MVRSVERLDYEGVQCGGRRRHRRRVGCSLLKEVGERRIALKQARGGANLPMPEQEVTMQDGTATWLGFRPPVPAEDWNAQISLLTGMAAADDHAAGPRRHPAHHAAAGRAATLARFRRQAAALGVTGREGMPYGEFLRTLDRERPASTWPSSTRRRRCSAAPATRPFDGEVPDAADARGGRRPVRPRDGAAAPARRPVRPGRVRGAVPRRRGAGVGPRGLASLPEVMARSDRVAAAVDRACTDAVEVASLQHLVGQTFRAVVVDARKDGGLIQIAEPAILAPLTGPAPAGSEVTARLVEADLGRRVLRFELVSVDEPAEPTEATEATEAPERPEPTG